MEKTWKPTTAGILSIIAGVIELLVGLGFAIGLGLLGSLGGLLPAGGILAVLAVPIIIIGIIALVGGIYALRRRVWGLALAGAICSLFGPWVLLGILAIIFVSLGKGEFK